MAKSHYMGKKSLPTFEGMCAELLAWYAFAQRDAKQFQEGLVWYDSARAECNRLAELYGFNLHTVCQVVAAISPGKPWPVNIRDAEYILQVWLTGVQSEKERFAYLLERKYQTGYTWENTRNAFCVLDTGDPIPPERIKTFCFADNLENTQATELVTIDLHMAHILGKTRLRGPVNVNACYDSLASVVVFVGNLLGIEPKRLQSVVWHARVQAFIAGYSVESLCDLIASIAEVEDE